MKISQLKSQRCFHVFASLGHQSSIINCKFASNTETEPHMSYKKASLIIALTLALTACTEGGEPDLEIDAALIETYETHYIENNLIAREVRAAKERLEEICMEDLGFPVRDYGLYGHGFEDWDAKDVMRDVWTKPVLGEDYSFVVRPWEDDHNEGAWELLPPEERDIVWAAAFGNADDVKEIEFPAGGGVVQWNDGGCAGTVNDLVHEGDVEDFMRLYVEAVGGHFGAWDSTDEVTAAQSEWSACMEEFGFEGFQHPRDAGSEALNAAFDMVDSGSPRSEDIESFELFQAQIQTADIECHDRTDLEQIQSDAFWKERTAMLIAYEVAVFSFYEEAEAALERAQDALNSGQLIGN
jgi:hypothetical protein